MRLPATAEESSHSAPGPQTACRVGGGKPGWGGWREATNGGKNGGKMGLTASTLVGRGDGGPERGWEAAGGWRRMGVTGQAAAATG